jgi:hypothetical protein
VTQPKARRSQLISTYGIGGLFPSSTTSYMIAGLHEWKEDRAEPLSEPRLARSLKVTALKQPPAGGRKDVPVIRFPYTQVCPSCRRIGRLHELSKDWNIAECSKDKQPLNPFRLIVACRRGHIDEFPYFQWLHRGQGKAGSDHLMKLEARGRTSSLADLVLTCTCGVENRNLDGAIGPLADFGPCRGARPWLGPENESCEEIPRVLQRGASNVWYPAVRSSISIPPYSEALSKFVDKHWPLLADPDVVTPALLGKVAELSDGKYAVDQIVAEIDRRRGEEQEEDDLSEARLRSGEYRALIEGRDEEDLNADFVCLPRDVPGAFDHLITDVRKVTRLREVRALYGFSRLDGAGGSDSNLCPLAPSRTNWLPAIQVIGEGIFIAFDRGELAKWADRPFARDRARMLKVAADRNADEYGHAPVHIDIVEVALHTLAHVIIDQLSLDAGYPAAALRERLYIDDDMAGLLIYTASSDSAGSLGGVAAMAETDQLGNALAEGLVRLSWCSSDPVCIESRGAGSDALNLAACHACVLVPETSCEKNNSFLDRALLFGTRDGGNEAEGIFSEFVANAVGV